MMNRSKEDKDETIVYVGGLHTDVNKEDIESEFQKFGKLLRVWVAFNPPGFAFVEFIKKEDAEAAVKALHDATILGSRLRVEISRGRGRGGRGGGRGGSDRGGRGGFRGGRGSDFGRGSFGSGRPSPYDRNDDVKSFRGRGDSRFDNFRGRRQSSYDDRDLGFGARRGGARVFEDLDPPRFGANRNFRDVDTLRGYGDRDTGRRDFPERDFPNRDFPNRDLGGRNIGGRDIGGRDIGGIPPRDIEDRDFPPRNFSGDLGNGRDLRDFGLERDVNGISRYGGNARDAPFGGGMEVGNTRDFGVSQATIPARDYGHGAPTRDIGGGRNFVGRDNDDFVGNRGIGTRREAVRDFNPPRDIGDLKEFGGRSAQGGRFEAGGGFGDRGGLGGFGDRGGPGGFGDRGGPGGFGGGRFSGGNVGGSGDYDDYAARDRFRSRSPIGRGRPY